MNIEEAAQKLEFVNRYKTYKDTYSNMELDAIETVLNELDKNTETINELINEVTIKDSEIELKDKVINLMAGRLTTEYHDVDFVEEFFYKMANEILEKN